MEGTAVAREGGQVGSGWRMAGEKTEAETAVEREGGQAGGGWRMAGEETEAEAETAMEREVAGTEGERWGRGGGRTARAAEDQAAEQEALHCASRKHLWWGRLGILAVGGAREVCPGPAFALL